MPGWRGEADEEDIERHAQHTVNNEGRREYKEAYELAMTMIGRGQSEMQIRRAIVREPAPPRTNMHGQVGKNGRMMYEAAQALAEVRRKAVEDCAAR